MTSGHHLAQLNVGTLLAPIDDPRIAGFTGLLDAVNALADEAEGFVWRLVGEGENNATSLRPRGDTMIVNMSVWESREVLWNYVYRSAHLDAMRGRREWFAPSAEPHMVLWWIPAGHLPTVDEALGRLDLLRAQGPGPEAFTFRTPFTPEGRPDADPGGASGGSAHSSVAV